MSEELRLLLVDQSDAIFRLKRVLINFKKLPKANVTLAKTKGRLADLRERWEETRHLHRQICRSATPDDRESLPYFLTEEFNDAEEAYHDALDHLNEAISRFVTVEDPASPNTSDSSFRYTPHGPALQLPRISLPKFSGVRIEWENFRNTFESLVANQEALTNTQKLHYLKSSVTGEAARLIANLRVSDTNYEPAWQILLAEYDDVQALIHAHLSSFVDLPIMKIETAVEIKRLRDSVSACLAALTNLGRPVEHWDDILVFLVAQKFSQKTRNAWNLRRCELSEPPKYKELHVFLTLRIRGLTDLSDVNNNVANTRNRHKSQSNVHNAVITKCALCTGTHNISQCKEFSSKSVVERNNLVRQHRLCFNCLRAGHFTQKCPSKINCRHCARRHHSLLHGYHLEALGTPNAQATATAAPIHKSDLAAAGSAAVANVQLAPPNGPSVPNVLLATAWVDLHTREGRTIKVRALLDQGSNFSFISESLCQTLRTKRQRADLQIRCFGDNYSGIAKSRVTVTLSPCSASVPSFPLTAYVYQRITSYAASRIRPIDTWSHLRDIALADPDPSSRHPIHLLIGADLYGSLLLGELRKGPVGTPTAQKTAFGWILSGPTDVNIPSPECASVFHCDSSLETNRLLQRFWQDEELPQRLPLTEEEAKCEEHFLKTHTRMPDGRYVVRLPFKQGHPVDIGASLPIARSLYERTEKKLQNLPDVRVQYNEFLREYETLGHMKPVEDQQDYFHFVITTTPLKSLTKRSILSTVAKLYDPLGWASPAIITAKILLQELWLAQGDWDDPVPPDLSKRWIAYYEDLPHLRSARIPRWTGRSKENYGVEIHGFADASTRAYAAVAYIRVLHTHNDARISILAAKTKVAPIKTISVPRLELNAVVLLSRLIKWIVTCLNLSHIPLYGWTDSTIVLAWLKQPPTKWQTYVANRVAEVQTTSPTIRWRHVSSENNPADCASRGISASELVSHDLWWSGPTWLRQPSTTWPMHESAPTLDSIATTQMSAEARKSTALHIASDPEWTLPNDCSTWTKLVRVTAYVLRFIDKLKRRRQFLAPFDSPTLTVAELKDATTLWLSKVQNSYFTAESHALKNGSPVKNSSPLRTLNPLIGDDKLIRLGGRLSHSALSYDEQHPIILPKHRISELLIDQAHKITLHGGTQLTLRTLRQRYWILGARNQVKARIRQCVVCARYAATPSSQLMGDLPSPRVTRSSPFEHAGVDYAGPFLVTPYVGRGQKTTKNYVALFVCLATKAIHLENVDDCSADGFLAAFRRFASRRGLPSHLYSDNATNFSAADRELSKSFEVLTSDSRLRDTLTNDGVTWHFIPPSAPHFGGLWEAGVKSFKKHFRRIVGSRTISRAEFATLLCAIEACLNSRPIAALSDDPTDFACLTPGHFLIGRPLVSVPEESVSEIACNRLSRWQFIRLMQEQIWRSWTQDYLCSLQNRNKWITPQRNLEINELVLLKNSMLPPCKWELARVQETHPGSDGRVRVVTLKTANSTFKRPIAQICRLPVPFERHNPTSM